MHFSTILYLKATSFQSNKVDFHCFRKFGVNPKDVNLKRYLISSAFNFYKKVLMKIFSPCCSQDPHGLHHFLEKCWHQQFFRAAIVNFHVWENFPCLLVVTLVSWLLRSIFSNPVVETPAWNTAISCFAMIFPILQIFKRIYSFQYFFRRSCYHYQSSHRNKRSNPIVIVI